MSRILIVKTSSLGDVVHMLPAVTDIVSACPGTEIDWVVEEHFQEVVNWHPSVDRIFPVAVRRWRKAFLKPDTRRQIKAFRQQVGKRNYDLVIDAQGLVKSAVIARFSSGVHCGYDKKSIREPFASRFYQQCYQVSRQLHAIERNRQLCAKIFDYDLSSLPMNYGISDISFAEGDQELVPEAPYIVAFHGTSRVDKEWPVEHWDALIHRMEEAGMRVLLPWGNAREKERADHLSEQCDAATVLPRSDLTALAAITQKARAVIGMDTGLMHVAAALGKSGLALYPATKPELTGVLASHESIRGIENISGEEAVSADFVISKMLSYLR